jgi:hypothetical protein
LGGYPGVFQNSSSTECHPLCEVEHTSHVLEPAARGRREAAAPASSWWNVATRWKSTFGVGLKSRSSSVELIEVDPGGLRHPVQTARCEVEMQAGDVRARFVP